MQIADLMRMYAQLERRLSVLDQEASSIKATLTTITGQLDAAIPPESMTVAHTFEGGEVVTFKRSSTERFVTKDGEADQFFQWVQANNLWAFMKRDFLQSRITEFQKATGQMPPHIVTMTTKKSAVTVKGAAPASASA
jgi:hypothetical protein